MPHRPSRQSLKDALEKEEVKIKESCSCFIHGIVMKSLGHACMNGGDFGGVVSSRRRLPSRTQKLLYGCKDDTRLRLDSFSSSFCLTLLGFVLLLPVFISVVVSGSCITRELSCFLVKSTMQLSIAQTFRPASDRRDWEDGDGSVGWRDDEAESRAGEHLAFLVLVLLPLVRSATCCRAFWVRRRLFDGASFRSPPHPSLSSLHEGTF
jgi:hypothetical protein